MIAPLWYGQKLLLHCSITLTSGSFLFCTKRDEHLSEGKVSRTGSNYHRSGEETAAYSTAGGGDRLRLYLAADRQRPSSRHRYVLCWHKCNCRVFNWIYSAFYRAVFVGNSALSRCDNVHRFGDSGGVSWWLAIHPFSLLTVSHFFWFANQANKPYNRTDATQRLYAITGRMYTAIVADRIITTIIIKRRSCLHEKPHSVTTFQGRRSRVNHTAAGTSACWFRVLGFMTSCRNCRNNRQMKLSALWRVANATPGFLQHPLSIPRPRQRVRARLPLVMGFTPSFYSGTKYRRDLCNRTVESFTDMWRARCCKRGLLLDQASKKVTMKTRR